MSASHDIDIAYDVLSGAEALIATAFDLAENVDDQPMNAIERDRMIFVLRSMAEKSQTCARSLIDIHEARAAPRAA